MDLVGQKVSIYPYVLNDSTNSNLLGSNSTYLNPADEFG